jgi:hypothetical protein
MGVPVAPCKRIKHPDAKKYGAGAFCFAGRWAGLHLHKGLLPRLRTTLYPGGGVHSEKEG